MPNAQKGETRLQQRKGEQKTRGAKKRKVRITGGREARLNTPGGNI